MSQDHENNKININLSCSHYYKTKWMINTMLRHVMFFTPQCEIAHVQVSSILEEVHHAITYHAALSKSTCMYNV